MADLIPCSICSGGFEAATTTAERVLVRGEVICRKASFSVASRSLQKHAELAGEEEGRAAAAGAEAEEDGKENMSVLAPNEKVMQQQKRKKMKKKKRRKEEKRIRKTKRCQLARGMQRLYCKLQSTPAHRSEWTRTGRN